MGSEEGEGMEGGSGQREGGRGEGEGVRASTFSEAQTC